MAKIIRKKKTSNKTNLSKLRHSASHLLAAAVLNLFPKTQLGIGPATEEGFYYDFLFPKPIDDSDLAKIETEMHRLAKKNLPFKHSEKGITAALNWAKKENQPFKQELIKNLKQKGEKKVSFYSLGNFVDLCKGPHAKSSGEIGAFKLTSLAGAYWRGDERNPQLTRIYGTAFPTEEELKAHLEKLEEAKKRDHRILGEKLELFSFKPEGPAFPFWHPKGTLLVNNIINYLRPLLEKEGYQEIKTPLILSEELWKKSGHFDHYKDNMYFTEIEGKKFAIRPMNCPGAVLVFKGRLRSYRDLPLRFSEFGLVHRHELSGVVQGLFRTRAFVQDDAHVFCTHEEQQIKNEIKKMLRLINRIYRDFGLNDVRIELSTRPDKSMGDDTTWQLAEKVMHQILKEEKVKAQVNEGEGAFYGPKFDFHIRDSLGRSWQLGTIQLDFSMPQQLGAYYIDEKGTKTTPIMIHRALVGSLERFIGILIEHYGGLFPLWLAPVQIKIIPVGKNHLPYAKKIKKELAEKKFRTELDKSDESVSKRIRNGEIQKIPYLIVVGENEKKKETISVREVKTGKVKESKVLPWIQQMQKKLLHP